MNNIIKFNKDKEKFIKNKLEIEVEDNTTYCQHSYVLADEKNRTIQCRKCESFLDPFDYILIWGKKIKKKNNDIHYLEKEITKMYKKIQCLKKEEKNTKARINNLKKKEHKNA